MNPLLTPAQVKDIILTTVTPLKKLQGKVASGGLLNVLAAVKKAQSLL